ncbi:hypothetical protein BGX23_000250 [Mortierella sp. AD031]|nr:hypothetical protein BGX23_000250 [Mortierella sp. AD031]
MIGSNLDSKGLTQLKFTNWPLKNYCLGSPTTTYPQGRPPIPARLCLGHDDGDDGDDRQEGGRLYVETLGVAEFVSSKLWENFPRRCFSYMQQQKPGLNLTYASYSTFV